MKPCDFLKLHFSLIVLQLNLFFTKELHFIFWVSRIKQKLAGSVVPLYSFLLSFLELLSTIENGHDIIQGRTKKVRLLFLEECLDAAELFNPKCKYGTISYTGLAGTSWSTTKYGLLSTIRRQYWGIFSNH